MKKEPILQFAHVEFDRSRLRVYYGNIGEIVAQEVLRKQGFEVLLPRPIADERNYLSIFRLPEMIDENSLRRHYEIHVQAGSISKDDESWEDYLSSYKESDIDERKRVKNNIAFFGDQLNSFKQYLKRLKDESITYFLDLIAKKDNTIYVIEVKSTKSACQFLKGEKLRGLKLAREYGFIPAVITFELQIEAANFKMIEVMGVF